MQSTKKRAPSKSERAHIERITGMDETKALAATVERLMAEAFA